MSDKMKDQHIYFDADLNVTIPAFPLNFQMRRNQEQVFGIIQKINLAIAIFGVLGNIINIYILTRKRTRRWSRGTLELVAYTGLVALAASDMMYCTMMAVEALVVDRGKLHHSSVSISMVIGYCSTYVLNLFSYFSTWLTVLMALNRYLAICHPIYTRICARQNLLRKVMLFIFLCWAVLLLPDLLETERCYSNCQPEDTHNGSTSNFTGIPPGDCGCVNSNQTNHPVYRLQAWLTDDTALLTASQVFNNVVGFIIPAIAMIFCNVHIILKLRATRKMRRELGCVDVGSRRSSSHAVPDKPVTYSLCMVVLLFLILVTPSEVLNILRTFCDLCNSNLMVLHMANEVANVMNTLNFATNFLLYCLVNVHFRRTLSAMFCGHRRKVSREMSFMMCTRATSVDLL